MPTEKNRLNLRIAPENLTLIREAASANGQDMTSFILGAALAQARNVMIEDRVTRLTSDEFARLEHALEREPQALPQLTKLLQPTTDGERPAPTAQRTKTPSGHA